MASYFARWIFNHPFPLSARLSADDLNLSPLLSERRRWRYLASRTLLAEMMFMLFGISSLPKIIVTSCGKPRFADISLPQFSIAYAGNIVGVLLTTESKAGLDMEMLHSNHFYRSTAQTAEPPLTTTESIWIHAQQDPIEAEFQLRSLRRSVLKLTGQGQSGIHSLHMHPAAGRLRIAGESYLQVICDIESPLVWSCAVSPSLEMIKLWEWSLEKGWKNLRDIKARGNEPGSNLMRFTSIPVEKTVPFN